MKKPCIKCQQEQPLEEFYFQSTTGIRMNVCKVCHKRRATESQRIRRANYASQGLRLPKQETWSDRKRREERRAA